MASECVHRQLLDRLDEVQAANDDAPARLNTRAHQTSSDTPRSRGARLTTSRHWQLSDDLRRLKDQLRLVTAEKTRLETQQHQQQQQQQQQGCGVERRDAATQTGRQLDSSTLYQLFASITLDRLDQLQLRQDDGHLPSRDPPPANQRRRTTSLPADDVARPQPHPRHHSNNEAATERRATTADVKSPRLKSPPLAILKRLQPSRRRRRHRDDVIYTCTRPPITVRREAAPADVTAGTMTSPRLSSFDRLQRRRNGLTDPTCLQ